jgi:hypothetical protein
MYLITSGEYINQELENEFGEIPPSFLPLQNKRLFKHHLSKIPNGEITYLSVPDSYKIIKKDQLDLEKNSVRLITIPRRLTLGQSIVHALNSIGKYNEELNIIHGDTLFHEIDFPVDSFVISETKDNYNWAYLKSSNKNNIVYAGYFSFSNQNILIKSIIDNDYDFIKGITQYKNQIEVKDIYIQKWYDFGHVNTYFRSKSNLTTQRVFNDLIINNQVVHKSSTNSQKIIAESNWFNSIPTSLKIFTPQLYSTGIESGKNYYELEYLSHSTLSEIFVFGNNQVFVWEAILESCQNFLNTCYSLKPTNRIDTKYMDGLYAPKTIRRLNEFRKNSNYDIEKPLQLNGENYPSLIEIANKTSKLIKPVDPNDICVIHGDFCFSNILYDFRIQNIKVIDPRGLDANNNISIHGDIRYDIAKLAHSILGLYDCIVAKYYKLEEKDAYNYSFEIYTNASTKLIQEHFVNMKFNGKTLKELDTFPILVHLFLSMLPLHSDDLQRQKALISIALLIYKQINDDNYYSNGWS